MQSAKKKKVITSYGVHAKDTGSSQVQVAVITERINDLSEHLKAHPKDTHSKKGLLGLVGKRRKHLSYLKMHKKEDYEKLILELKLRK